MDELSCSNKLIKAYPLAKAIGQKRKKPVAANSVYRILEDLIQQSEILPVHSSNAFVKIDQGAQPSVILICHKCDAAKVIQSIEVHEGLAATVRSMDFHGHEHVLEVIGDCTDCS